jgi:hypothetical protein
MKRFRLGTLMLLVVIAAQGVGLVVQHQRAARREAELRVRVAEFQARVAEHKAELQAMRRLYAQQHRYIQDKLQKSDVTIGDTPQQMGVAEQGRPK